MKIPDNNQIFGFLHRYGIAFLVGITILFLAKNFIMQIVDSVADMNANTCSLRDLEVGGRFSYEGKSFKINEFNYSQYDYVGDSINIRLEEIKN